jgi:sporulation protein YlmC with PRC-barrel domain
VQVQGEQQQPQVRYERAEPRVVVNQPEGQPQVRVEEMQGQAPAGDQAQGQPPAAAQPTPGPQANVAAARPAPEATTTEAGPYASPLYSKRADELDGEEVYGPDGEQIGEIDEVVVDSASKRALAVIGVGGFLGIGERNVAIPLSDLQVDQNDRLIANVNRDNLRQMQPYQRGAYRAAEPARPLRDILGPE